MNVNIDSLTASFTRLLKDANTSTATYDLSESLEKRVPTVLKGVGDAHLSLPVPTLAYPLVMVQARNATREFRELGKTSRRDVTVNMSIIGVTHYGLGSADERVSRENADREAMQLANNIERIIDNNVTASNTVQWVRVSDSNYNSNIVDKTYNSVVDISLEAYLRQ